LLLAGGGGWLLYQRTAAARAVESALADVDDAQSRRDWPAARAALERAEARLAGWGQSSMRRRIDDLREDLDVLNHLDEIRLIGFGQGPGAAATRPARMDAEYAAVFGSLGIDPDTQPPEEVAARLRVRSAPAELASSLDDWAWLRRHELGAKARWRQLVEAARLTDDDETRTRLRLIVASQDWKGLQQLAEGIDHSAHPPLTLNLVGQYLKVALRYEKATDRDGVLAFLRKARLHHPDDFWINMQLAHLLGDPMRPAAYTEAASCYWAALAVRPRRVSILVSLSGVAVGAREFDRGIAVAQRALELAASPDDRARALHALGTAFQIKGELDRSLAALDEALRLNPKVWAVYHSRGHTRLKKGDRDGALADARAAVRLSAGASPNDNTALTHALLGKVLDARGELDAAIAAYRDAVRLNPHPISRAMTRNDLGNVLHRKGDFAGALAEYDAVVKVEPNDPVYLANRGNALLSLKRYAEASAAYRRALRLNPRDERSLMNLGNALKHQGKLPEAEAAYRSALVLDPANAKTHYNLGLLLSEAGRYAEAIAPLSEAVRLQSADAMFHHDLSISLRRTGQLDAALQASRKAVELSGKDGADRATCLLGLGNALSASGDPEGAAARFREAIEVRRDDAKAHDNLGIVLGELKRFDEAAAAHRKALALDPDLPFVRTNLGRSLLNGGKPALALPVLREAVQRRPKDWQAHFLLGATLRHLRERAGAAAALRQAIALAPLAPQCRIELGGVLGEQGRFTEALAAFRLGYELSGSPWAFAGPLAGWLRQAERHVELNARLPALLRGDDKPANARERIEFGTVAKLKRMYAAAARLYEQALGAEPALAEEQTPSHRYNAACYAALAAAGKGTDSGRLDGQERALLRRRALTWLRADLAAWARLLRAGKPQDRAALARALKHWQHDPDLAGLRDAEAVKQLPAEEGAACQNLWADVDALLKKAGAK
jgi:tetratricopeptide (TPR) repeat protein